MSFSEVYIQWFTEQPAWVKGTCSHVFRTKSLYLCNYTKKIKKIV